MCHGTAAVALVGCCRPQKWALGDCLCCRSEPIVPVMWDKTVEKFREKPRHSTLMATRIAAISATFLFGFGVRAAVAQIVGDPLGVVQVGTTPSDSLGCVVAVSNGCCASGMVVVAVGESNRSCDTYGEAEASGWLVGLGLLGAEGPTALGGGDTFGLVAVSDTGNARADCIRSLFDSNCAEPGVAVSGTGSATGEGSVVSGTGSAQTSWDQYDNDTFAVVAVSGLGNAGGGDSLVSVSGGSNADGYVAVAGRNANGDGLA